MTLEMVDKDVQAVLARGESLALDISSLLLVGYGNISRRDDGVALHILHRLRKRLGLSLDDWEANSSLCPDGGARKPLAMICVHQLAPEMAELVAQYDAVIFIDAHVPAVGWESVAWQEISPAYQAGMVGHQLKPGVVLALSRSLYGGSPRGYTLSVLGHDFDFGEELSVQTSDLADEAVSFLLGLIRAEDLCPRT
jgi:hydrogenase maturation protease